MNHEIEVFSKGQPLTINPSLAKVNKDMTIMTNDVMTLNAKIDDSMYILTKNVKENIKSILSQYFPHKEEVINTCNNSNNKI